MNNAPSSPRLTMNGTPMTAGSRLSLRLRTLHAVRQLGVLLAACLPGLIALPTQAAQLNLSESPLFTQNAVQQNIFFMLDDSGSMDWETVYNPGTQCNSANGTSTLDFTPDTTGTLAGCPSGGATPYTYTIVQVERLRLCVGFNTLSFDPAVTYTPWYGKDNAGVDYKNAWLYSGGTDASPNFTLVRQNAYLSGGAATNLTIAGTVAYRPWTDSNSNGDYEDGECGDKNSSVPNVLFSSLTDAQKKSFTNWYMYYRKREYVMKRAVTEIVKDSRARMGMSTLWRNSLTGTSVGIRIENVDDISVPVNATAATNKATLLNHLSRIDSSNGTPLRNALDNVGRYFEGTAQTALFGALPGHTGTISPNSPILSAATGGSCQQNFLVLTTDGYYNSGYTGTAVGNADGNSSSAYDSGSSGAAARPYGDGQSDTLGDIAMHYYERDLRTDLSNLVPTTTGIDEATHQHMVTYTVAFGLSGNLDPFNATATLCDSDPTNACWGGWPNQTPLAMQDTEAAVDDLWHAAYNGRGKFLSGRNPTLLAAALKNAIKDIEGRTGTASSVAASGSSASTSSRLYVPQFTSGKWQGALIALGFNASNQLIDVADWDVSAGTVKSDTGEVLAGQDWNSGRNILTSDGGVGTGKQFRWLNLSASQQSALNINPATATSDSKGSERLEYLRGDHSKEKSKPSGIYRDRIASYDNGNAAYSNFALGDIVNSAAVYVGPPSSFYPDSIESVSWASFRGTYVNRTPMVYVGANDGMLHGFAACKTSSDPAGCTASDLGREKIAYVPNRLFGRLNRLTDPAYTHSSYVDGTPTVTDVFYGGAWHTVLVGSLRGGGQGIFMLDVTNPSSFSEANASAIARWEFTDTNDTDLGYTYSQPVIVKMNNGKWAAVFSNGYNNSEGGGVGETGQGALFIVDIEDGTLIRKITVPAGSVATPNGLATPRVIDTNSDFKADIAYAGDLQGNLWKFNLRSSIPTDWSAAKLFTATDPGGTAQPITSKPEVTFHPAGQTGFMVFFGTGKYLEGGGTDTASTQVQTFYGIWDSVGAAGGATLVTTGTLITQTQVETTVGGYPARYVTTPVNNITAWGAGAGQNMGWKVNFTLSTGERVVASPQYLSDGRLLFVSNIPNTDPCAFGGDSWIYQLNTANGGPPAFTVFDVDKDGDFDNYDNSGTNVVVGVKTAGIVPQPLVLDTDGGRVIVTPSTMISDPKDSSLSKTDKNPLLGRQSWRQLR